MIKLVNKRNSKIQINKAGYSPLLIPRNGSKNITDGNYKTYYNELQVYNRADIIDIVRPEETPQPFPTQSTTQTQFSEETEPTSEGTSGTEGSTEEGEQSGQSEEDEGQTEDNQESSTEEDSEETEQASEDRDNVLTQDEITRENLEKLNMTEVRRLAFQKNAETARTKAQLIENILKVVENQ